MLRAENAYKLLGYALPDYSDRYQIDRLGIFSARYGMLTEWFLEETTGIMSGGRENRYPRSTSRNLGHDAGRCH